MAAERNTMRVLHVQLCAVQCLRSWLAPKFLSMLWVLHALLCGVMSCRPLYMIVAVSTILGVHVLR